MAIHKTPDSFSRYDPYADMLNTRPHVRAKGEVTPSEAIKDTLQVSQSQLKEEALSKLGVKDKYVIPQNSFMRIGKYVFVAIAFPPYLVCVGMPKWIVTEGIPLLLTWNQMLWNKVSEPAAKPLRLIRAKIEQILHFMQKMAQVLVSPVNRLGLEIYQHLNRFKITTANAFKKMAKAANKFLKNPKAAALSLFSKALIPVKNLQKFLLDKRESLSQKIQSGYLFVQKKINDFNNAPQLVTHWGKQQLQLYRAKIASWTNKIVRHFQGSQEKATLGTNWIAKQFNLLATSVKLTLKPVHSLYKLAVATPLELLTEVFKAGFKKLGDCLEENSRKMTAFFLKVRQKLLKVNAESTRDSWLSTSFFVSLPNTLQSKLRNLFFHPLFLSFLEAALKILKQGIELPLSAVAFLLAKSSTGFSKLSLLSNQCTDVIKKAFSKFQSYCHHTLFPKIALFFSRVIYFILLTGMIMIILLGWGWSLMGDLMVRLASYVSLRKTPA